MSPPARPAVCEPLDRRGAANAGEIPSAAAPEASAETYRNPPSMPPTPLTVAGDFARAPLRIRSLSHFFGRAYAEHRKARRYHLLRGGNKGKPSSSSPLIF